MNQQEMDAVCLDRLDGKLQVVRDRTVGVAKGYSSGLYLWGEGGTSKSYTVEQTLTSTKTPFKLSNTRITGKGLFELLRDFPCVVHVIEDVETLFRDKSAFGVLRSALWGQDDGAGQQMRFVAWQVAGKREEFAFTGGIIFIANRSMDDIPELRALNTRIPALRYQVTNEEIAALMRKIAQSGHRHESLFLSPQACLEVANEIVERSARLERNLDIRLLITTFKDRLQWENGEAKTHWTDLLDSRMKERVAVYSRASRKEAELVLVKRIAELPTAERLAAWQLETGKSQAALYRRLGEYYQILITEGK